MCRLEQGSFPYALCLLTCCPFFSLSRGQAAGAVFFFLSSCF